MQWHIQYKPTGTNPQERVKQIIEQLLINRGIVDEAAREAFFYPRHPSTFILSEIGISEVEADKAVERIREALNQQQQIIVYGDYDADGITATAIMWEVLHSLGAKVMPYLPDRFAEGYGMKVEAVKQLQEKYPELKLIVTVDQGIVAHEAIEYCREQGIDVIITDHHQPADSLPPAYAIIHTTQTSGSAVAWWFGRVLTKSLSTNTITKDNTLELATIGTVTDVIPLLGINRSLVAHGLAELRTTTRVGLIALLATASIKLEEIDTYHLGFVIGPRLNAMGRLEHALDALRLLCTRDFGRAQALAFTLNRTNQERQELTQSTFKHAFELAAQQPDAKVIIIGDQSYPEGIIGLVAGKLVEKFHKPAIVFSYHEGQAKASARSIAAFNIIEAIRSKPELLMGVGGHPMAAGLTLTISKLEEFKTHLLSYAELKLNEEDFQPWLKVETWLDFSDISEDLFSQLIRFAPFGYANQEPLFATENVTLRSFKIVGQQQVHLKLQVSQGNKIFNAIAFNQAPKASDLTIGQSVTIAYTIGENHWNGQTALELKIKDLKIST